MPEVSEIKDLIELFLLSESNSVFYQQNEEIESYNKELLCEEIAKVRVYLEERGVEKGDFIALTTTKSRLLLPAYWGTLWTGAIPVISPFQDDKQKALSGILLIKETLDERKLDQILCTQNSVCLENKAPDLEEQDLAIVFFTSGSTGNPKGVGLTHQNILAHLNAVKQKMEYKSSDRFLNPLPLNHAYGFVFMYLMSLYCSAMYYDMDPEYFLNKPSILAELVTDKHITTISGMNFVLKSLCSLDENMINRYDFSKVKRIFLSAEPVSLDLIHSFLSKYRNTGISETSILPFYGMTEASASVTLPSLNNSKLVEEKGAISLGQILSTKKVRVLGSQGQPLRDGEAGEISISGTDVTGIYFTTDGKIEIGEWLRTGDRGFILGNELFLTDRVDDRMIHNGLNIFPGDVENSITSRYPEMGGKVFIRQSQNGDIVLFLDTSGMDWDREEEVKKLKQAKKTVDETYGIPVKAYIPTEIPVKGVGKKDFRLLMKQWTEGKFSSLISDVRRNWIREEINEKQISSQTKLVCTNIWKTVLSQDPEEEPDFYFAGGDSIKLIRIASELQKTLAKNVKLEDLKENLYFPDFLAMVEDLVSRGQKDLKEDIELVYHSDENGLYDTFSLTDVQMAYLMGRDQMYEMGGVSTHGYYEYETDLDPIKLENTVREMILLHPGLRLSFTDGGKQRILRMDEIPEFQIEVTDGENWSGAEQKEWIEHHRNQMSHEILPLDKVPLFKMSMLKYTSDRYYLIFSVDLLIIDASSLQRFKDEIWKHCKGTITEIAGEKYSFRDYIDVLNQRKHSARYIEDRNFWKEKIESFPQAPQLNYELQPENVVLPRFRRKEMQIDSDQWKSIKQCISERHLSPSAIIATIYAEVLAYYSGQSECAINFTVFDRSGLFNEFENTIGDFTSTALIPFDFTKPGSLQDRAAATQNSIFESIDHIYYSGIEFARDLKISRSMGGQSVMPYVFTSTLSENGNVDYEDLGTQVYGISQTPQVYIDCQVTQNTTGLYILWDYVEQLFSEELIDNMFICFQSAVESLKKILETDDDAVWPSDETMEFVNHYNDTSLDLNVLPLHELFRVRAKESPERIAVKDFEKEITYGELDQMSDLVADQIIYQGIKPGDCVAVKSWRRLESIVNLLGVLKAGCVYVPVDCDNPEERQNMIINACDAKICLEKDEFMTPINNSPHVHHPTVRNEDLAYIIFTSGSTGTPKGVMITHGAASNTILDINGRFNVTNEDRVIGLSSLCFDLSVYDIFGTLAAGASLVMVPDIQDLSSIIRIMRDEEISIWNSVPAVMQMYVEQQELENLKYRKDDVSVYEDSLRLVMMSGDWIPMDLPERIRNIFFDVDIYSLGGATEASIWSIYYPIDQINYSWTSIPYGTPLANQMIYIMRDDLKVSPVGVIGEICIGGKGVAQGYLKEPQKTEDFFFQHPLYGYLYRTGDFGILHENGLVEFVGRKDSQIKIHGHRIELGEIESALRKIDCVEDAVVLSRKLNENDSTLSIVAYVVADNSNENEIKRKVGEKVPEYMVPKAVVFLDRIPYTANQKVDRKKLLKIEIEGIQHVIKKPVTELQKQIFDIWKSVLETDNFGINDDFMEVGGDSIKLIRVTYEIEKKLHRKVSNRDLLIASTIERQEAVVATGSIVKDVLRLEPDTEHENDPFDLTDVQRAYLMGRDEMFELGGISTHAYYEYEIDLDLERFNAALNKVIKSQPMLRCVMQRGGKQRFLPENIQYHIEIEDLRTLSDQEFNEALLKERQKYSHEIFNPYNWPLFRLKALRKNDLESVLLFSIDLMIMDAGSVLLFKDLVMKAYDKEQYVPDPIQFTFRDFVSGLKLLVKRNEYQLDKKYWNQKTADFPEAPQLPLLMKTEDVRKPTFRRLSMILGKKEWNQLKDQCRLHNVSPSALICAVYVKTLAYYSNQRESVINVTLFNRYEFHDDVTKMIGDFTSTMLLSFSDENRDLWSSAQNVQQILIEGLEHSSYSGVDFGRDIKNIRKNSRPVAPIVFTSTLAGGDTSNHREFGKVLYGISQTSQVYLDCQLSETEGELNVTWDYITALLDHEVMNQMFDLFEEVIHEVADGKYVKGYITDAEKNTEKLYKQYNNTDDSRLKKETLHGMFMKQASQTPDNLAVKDQNSSMTYRELNEESDRLCALLRSKGVYSGDFVAISVHREVKTVAYLLAILKAGAAYVPIEPDNPESRKNEILIDCGCRIFIDGNIKNFGSGELVPNRKEEGNIHDPDSIAYIIYTSGSTGIPKGVVITHSEASNTIQDINRRFQVNEEDRIIGLSSMNFDLSVYDIFGAFAAGAALIMPESLYNINNLIDVVNTESITIWNSVPAIVQMYIEYLEKRNTFEQEANRNMSNNTITVYENPIRLILMSGDWIPVNLPERIRHQIDDVEIISLGGATEASIWSIYYPIRNVSEKWKSIPYGFALSNQQWHILDDFGRHCPPGVTGELCIGGVGLAEGYLNNPEKTEEAFFKHPEYGRLYRTGDFGRMTSEGYIEFMGRRDSQVKVGGHRVELGEIESAFFKIKHVKDLAIIKKDQNGVILCAYVVYDGILNVEEIKSQLKLYLPEYMVPPVIMQINEIPLTSNGKIDRKKLEKMEISLFKHKFIAPRNKAEEKLAEIFRNILGLKEVSIDHSFAELGGDSLKILQMISQIEEKTGVKIPYSMIMFGDTIEEIAMMIRSMERNKQKGENEVQRDLPYYHSNPEKPVRMVLLPPLVGMCAPYMRLLDVIPLSSIVLFDYKKGDSTDDLVSRYVEQILQFNLSDNLIIGGHSAGGNFAFEIVKSLEAKNVKVSKLLMMDSFYFKNINNVSDKKVKSIFRILIKEMVLDGQDIDSIYDVLDNYIEKLIVPVTGKVKADIVYLKSEPPYLDIKGLELKPDEWDQHTEGNFKIIQGQGTHIRMLYLPFIRTNSEIIREEFNLN